MVIRWIAVRLTLAIAAIALIGTGAWLVYLIDIVQNPHIKGIALENRWLALGILTLCLTAVSLLETLLVGLLTRLKWISDRRGRMGIGVFSAIALLINILTISTAKTWSYGGVWYVGAIAFIVLVVALFSLGK